MWFHTVEREWASGLTAHKITTHLDLTKRSFYRQISGMLTSKSPLATFWWWLMRYYTTMIVDACMLRLQGGHSVLQESINPRTQWPGGHWALGYSDEGYWILGVTESSDTGVGMDMYRWYAGFSPASKGSAMLSKSKYWAGSAGPASLPL